MHPPVDPASLPSTGVASIDAQHRRLMEIFAHLDAGLRAGRDREVLSPVMDELAAYAVEHCAHEEALLERAGYPELAGHRAQHRAFSGKIAEMAAAYRAGNPVLGPEVSRFLANWIADHIRRSDVAYIPALRSAGLA